MSAESPLINEHGPQQVARSTEAGKKGKKSNWRGWQKRGRGGYRGRGRKNYSEKTNSTEDDMNNVSFNENYSESLPGGSWASQEGINMVEQGLNTNRLDDKENSLHGRPWNRRRQEGWKKWGSHERNEECQDVDSQEMKFSGRGRSGYQHSGRGRGKMQQHDGCVEREENIDFNSAENFEKSRGGLDSEEGDNASGGRGFKRGRGYFRFRGRGRKKQYVNNLEENHEENDASSQCTNLSDREGGSAWNNSLERTAEIEDDQEHNRSSRQYRGRGGYRDRGHMHQRGSYIQKNNGSNRGEEIILSDEGSQLDIHGNSVEMASYEESTHGEITVNAGRWRGNKAARGKGYFRGRGRNKQNFYDASTKQGENSFQESRHFSGKRGGGVRSNNKSFLKQGDSVERDDDEGVIEPNDARYNGFATSEKNVLYETNNTDIFLEDISIASEENKFPKPRSRNRRGQWRNQNFSESTRYRNNKVSSISDGCVEELVSEDLNGLSNFPSENGSYSTENKEHPLEKTNESAYFENNDVPKRRRRNRRRKWKNYNDKQNNAENIFAYNGGLDINTADDERNCLDNNKKKTTKTINQQPDIIQGDNSPTFDRKSFESWLSANWVEIAKGGMPTYPDEFIYRDKQEPKQDLDKKKDSNKISLQDLFSNAPPLIDKGYVSTEAPDTSSLTVITAADTAQSQTMSSASKTVDVLTPSKRNTLASTSVATTLPVSITATTKATDNADKAFTSIRDNQTLSNVTTTVFSSIKANPQTLSKSVAPSRSDLSTALVGTSKAATKAVATTTSKIVHHPTATSTASAKINSSVAIVTGSTDSVKISPSSSQTLPKTAISNNLIASSSSSFTNAQSPGISSTVKSQPVINISSSLQQVSATGFSNPQSHKTSLPSAVIITPQQNITDSSTRSFATPAAVKRKTVSNTVKRDTRNSNKLEYEITGNCKLVIKSYGDIVKEKSELLVCVLGQDADMRKTKVGQSFNKEFPSHWQELLAEHVQNPYSRVLTIHNPLGFNGKAICHILLSPWNRAKSQDQIDLALQELFDVVDDLNIQSISIPPLGCGLAFKFPPKYMVRWLLEHIKNMTIRRYLKKIVLLAPSSELFDEFKTQASNYFDYANTYSEDDVTEEPVQIGDIFYDLKPKRGTLEYMNYLARQETVLPSYWNLGKSNAKSWWGSVKNYFTGAKPYYVVVSEETKAAISKLVTGSQDPHVIGHGADAVGMNYSSIKVIDVQRIEQPALFEKYHKRRKEILDKRIRKGSACQDVGKITGSKGKVLTKTLLNDTMKDELYSEINEHYLFHGTKVKALDNIIENGFDPSCSKALSLFGQGIYTAEKSTKADQYADDKSSRSPNGTKLSLILARVLLGDVFVCDENHPCLESKVCRKLTKPPCIRCQDDLCFCGSQEHYDSVMGDGKWLFREFVVYEGSQCYPEYLITYQRV